MTKISTLPLAEEIDGTEQLVMVQDGVTKRGTTDNIAAKASERIDAVANEFREALDPALTPGLSVSDRNGLASLLMDSLRRMLFSGGGGIAGSQGLSLTNRDGLAGLHLDALGRLLLAGGGGISGAIGLALTDHNGLAGFHFNPNARDLLIAGRIRSNRKMRTGLLTEIAFVPHDGQSWSMGYENIDTPMPQRWDNLCFVPGGVRTQCLNRLDPDNLAYFSGFGPLVERQDVGSPKYSEFLPNGLGQTLATGFGDMVKETLAWENHLTPEDMTHRLLCSAPGEGNCSLDDLSKGGPWDSHSRIVLQAVQAAQRCAEQGLTFSFPMVTWTQGAYATELANGYGARLEARRALLQADTDHLFSRRTPLKFTTWQRYCEGDITPAIAYAAFVQTAKDHEHIICAGPSYFLPHMPMVSGSGGAHLTETATDWLAAYYALAYWRVVIMGLPKLPPLDTQDCYVNGNVLIVQFNSEYALQFETDLVTPVENMGFERVSASGDVLPLAMPQIIGHSLVKFTANSAWSPSDRLVYGGAGASGATDGSAVGPHLGMRGNLRDSQGDWIVYDRGFRNLPMHNFLVCFDKSISSIAA